MPTYEFKCPKCGITIEQSFSVYTNATVGCQPCQVPMDRTFTAPAVIFKGEGWAGKA